MQAVRFDAPPLNAGLRDAAAKKLRECVSSLSDAEIEMAAEFYGRSVRHEYASVFECVQAKRCDAWDKCGTFTGSGTIGAAIGARQLACGASCADPTLATGRVLG